MNRDYSTIAARIILKNAAAPALDVLIMEQDISEYAYESGKDGSKLQMYE